MNKADVRLRILDQLQRDLALQTGAAALARDEAISEESKPENKYDTHSQEAAYLAEGQARLAAEISESIALYQGLAPTPLASGSSVAVGALLRVDQAGKGSWYFLGPRAGGMEIEIEGATVLVVTPSSPLGRELLGKRVGDPVRLPGKSNATARVASVQ